MQLLEDVFIIENLQIINEGQTGPMRVKGCFQRADEENNNKRIYSKPLLEREITKLAEAITERRLMGELDHPQHDSVKLSNVSHLITGLNMKGNEVIGEAEILDTPAGKVAQALIRGGVKVGVSSRGMGTVSEDIDGKRHVNEDFKLITWDLVADPSTRGAYPGLTESTQIQEIIDKVLPEAHKVKNFTTLLKESLNEGYKDEREQAYDTARGEGLSVEAAKHASRYPSQKKKKKAKKKAKKSKTITSKEQARLDAKYQNEPTNEGEESKAKYPHRPRGQVLRPVGTTPPRSVPAPKPGWDPRGSGKGKPSGPSGFGKPSVKPGPRKPSGFGKPSLKPGSRRDQGGAGKLDIKLPRQDASTSLANEGEESKRVGQEHARSISLTGPQGGGVIPADVRQQTRAALIKSAKTRGQAAKRRDALMLRVQSGRPRSAGASMESTSLADLVRSKLYEGETTGQDLKKTGARVQRSGQALIARQAGKRARKTRGRGEHRRPAKTPEQIKTQIRVIRSKAAAKHSDTGRLQGKDRSFGNAPPGTPYGSLRAKTDQTSDEKAAAKEKFIKGQRGAESWQARRGRLGGVASWMRDLGQAASQARANQEAERTKRR